MKRRSRRWSRSKRRRSRPDVLPLSICPTALPFLWNENVGTRTLGTCALPGTVILNFPTIEGGFGSTEAGGEFTDAQQRKLEKLSKGLYLKSIDLSLNFYSVNLNIDDLFATAPNKPVFISTFYPIRYAIMVSELSNDVARTVLWAQSPNFLDFPNLFDENENKKQSIIHRGEALVPIRFFRNDIIDTDVNRQGHALRSPHNIVRRHIRLRTHKRINEDQGLYLLLQCANNSFVDIQQVMAADPVNIGPEFDAFGVARLHNLR